MSTKKRRATEEPAPAAPAQRTEPTRKPIILEGVLISATPRVVAMPEGALSVEMRNLDIQNTTTKQVATIPVLASSLPTGDGSLKAGQKVTIEVRF